MPAAPVIALVSLVLAAASVETRYCGAVDITTDECTALEHGDFIHFACYQPDSRRLVLELKKNRYVYCEIDAGTVQGLIESREPGRYYRAFIRGNFVCDCRR